MGILSSLELRRRNMCMTHQADLSGDMITPSSNISLNHLYVKMPYLSLGVQEVNVFSADEAHMTVPQTGDTWTVNTATLTYLGFGKYHFQATNTTGATYYTDYVDIVPYNVPSASGRKAYFRNTVGSGTTLYMRYPNHSGLDSWSMNPAYRVGTYSGMAGKEFGAFYLSVPSGLGSAGVDMTFQFMPAVNETTLATITLPTTIYGGTLDVVRGRLISEYAADGTRLIQPVVYSVTPASVTLTGGKFVYSDSGSLKATYLV